MALISMCCHDTKENGRTELTKRTIRSIRDTVNFDKHRMIVVNNGSCFDTRNFLASIPTIGVIDLPENIGTARGLNLVWKERRPGEHCLKIDNDCVIHDEGWLDILEECVERDDGVMLNGKKHRLGIVGLKRKDLTEWVLKPKGTNDHSFFHPFPHDKTKFQRWMAVEVVNHCIGTCCLFSSALLDKIGYLYQFGVYGLDDGLAAVRAHAAGFYSCFWPWIEIDHIDKGGTEYTDWKVSYATKELVEYKGEKMTRVDQFNRVKREYLTGERSFYHGVSDE